MAGRRILYLTALVGCLVFYIFYRQWMSFLLLVLVLALPWLSLLVSLPAMVTTKVTVDCPAFVPLGNDAAGKLRAVSPFPLPPIRGKIRVVRPLGRVFYRLRDGSHLPTDHCGGLLCSGEKIRVYDYLGLFRRRIRRTAPVTVLVLPAPIPMALSQTQRVCCNFRPKTGGGFAENHELRLYRPGDDLRSIHWKLSQKTGSLILREALEPVRGRVLVTVDLCGTDEELDRKLGKLRWLCEDLLAQGFSHEIHALSGAGLSVHHIADERDLNGALRELLCAYPATEGTVADAPVPAYRHYHIGGDADET